MGVSGCAILHFQTTYRVTKQWKRTHILYQTICVAAIMLGPHLLRQPHWQETLRLRMANVGLVMSPCHSFQHFQHESSSQVFFNAKPWYLTLFNSAWKKKTKFIRRCYPTSPYVFWSQRCSGSTVLKTSLGFHIKLNQPESVWQLVMLKASSVLPKQLELRLQDERNLWTVALEQSEAINTALEIWKEIFFYSLLKCH
jgi:hypothetical protein